MIELTERVAVAGGGTPMGRILAPLTWDDVTREYGDRDYTAMQRDPVIAANLQLYASSVVAADPQVVSAVTDHANDGYDLAGALAQTISDGMENMAIQLLESLRDIVVAMLTYGCKISESVWRMERSAGQTRYALHALKPKPRDALALRVDPYQNVIGLDARVLQDGALRRVTLPPDGFLITTFRSLDSDPRGTSLLRPAYVAWDLKMRTWPEYYKYLVQFASPSLWATTPPNAMDERDADGTVVDAVTALLQKLLQFQNGSALAMANGGQVDALFSQGEGQAFLSAFELFDRQMTTAMFAATRATMEAQHGSRADSTTAFTILDTFITQTRLSLERALRQQVLMPLVRANYGDQAARLTPYLSLGGVTEEDVIALMGAVARLQSVKYLSPSQLPELDARLNLAARTPDELAAMATQPIPSPLQQDDRTPTPDQEGGTEDATDPAEDPAPAPAR